MPTINWFYVVGVIVILVILAIVGYTCKEIITAKRRQPNDEIVAATRTLMVWTAVLAAATVLMAYFAYFTLDAIRGQLAEMRFETQQTYLSERAFVFIEPLSQNFDSWRSGLAPFQWHYRLVNYGKTPARVIKIIGYASITDQPAPFDIKTPYIIRKHRYILPSSPSSQEVSTQHIPPEYILSASEKSSAFTALADHSPLVTTGVPNDILREHERVYENSTMPSEPGMVRPWLIVNVDYVDIFGRRYAPLFCFTLYWGQMIESGDRPCNNAGGDR